MVADIMHNIISVLIMVSVINFVLAWRFEIQDYFDFGKVGWLDTFYNFESTLLMFFNWYLLTAHSKMMIGMIVLSIGWLILNYLLMVKVSKDWQIRKADNNG